jgi:hypothetical protein
MDHVRDIKLICLMLLDIFPDLVSNLTTSSIFVVFAWNGSLNLRVDKKLLSNILNHERNTTNGEYLVKNDFVEYHKVDKKISG